MKKAPVCAGKIFVATFISKGAGESFTCQNKKRLSFGLHVGSSVACAKKIKKVSFSTDLKNRLLNYIYSFFNNINITNAHKTLAIELRSFLSCFIFFILMRLKDLTYPM